MSRSVRMRLRSSWALFACVELFASEGCGFPDVSYQQPANSTVPADAQVSDASAEVDGGQGEATPLGGPQQMIESGAATPDSSGDESVSDRGHEPDGLDATDANAIDLEGGRYPPANGSALSDAAPDSQSGSSSGGSSSGGSSSGSGGSSSSSSGGGGALACACDGGQSPYPIHVTTCIVIGNGASAVCSPGGFVGDDPGCLGVGTLLVCVPVKNTGGIVRDCLSEELSTIQSCH